MKAATMVCRCQNVFFGGNVVYVYTVLQHVVCLVVFGVHVCVLSLAMCGAMCLP